MHTSCRLPNEACFLLAQDPEAVFAAVALSMQVGYFDDPPHGKPTLCMDANLHASFQWVMEFRVKPCQAAPQHRQGKHIFF